MGKRKICPYKDVTHKEHDNVDDVKQDDDSGDINVSEKHSCIPDKMPPTRSIKYLGLYRGIQYDRNRFVNEGRTVTYHNLADSVLDYSIQVESHRLVECHAKY